MPPRRKAKTTATQQTSRTRVSTMKTTSQTFTTKTQSNMNNSPASKTQSKAEAVKTTATASKPTTNNKRRQPPTKTTAPKAKKSRTAPSDSQPAKKVQRKRKTIISPIYEEVWREVYLAGTEWAQLQMVYAIDWDFDHLDEALNDGDLAGKMVHLFGATEPQLVRKDENDQKGDVVPIPTIVAVVSEKPPPSMVGLKSVQRAEEEIVEMAKLRMGWHSYAPPNVAHRRTFKPLVHVLKCNERRARLRNMDEAAVHKYDYVLPYFIKPEQLDDVDEDTNVQVLVDLEGRQAPLMCEYDYEMDDFEEFVDETLQENELDEKEYKEVVKKAIQEATRKHKQKNKAEKEERKKRIDAITPEEREAIKNMKLIKFYPSNEWPDISACKSRYVNRYYGQATEIRDESNDSN